jgi:hypothetical protein
MFSREAEGPAVLPTRNKSFAALRIAVTANIAGIAAGFFGNTTKNCRPEAECSSCEAEDLLFANTKQVLRCAQDRRDCRHRRDRRRILRKYDKEGVTWFLLFAGVPGDGGDPGDPGDYIQPSAIAKMIG